MATNKKIGKELWREIEELRKMVEESADLYNKSKMFDIIAKLKNVFCRISKNKTN